MNYLYYKNEKKVLESGNTQSNPGSGQICAIYELNFQHCRMNVRSIPPPPSPPNKTQPKEKDKKVKNSALNKKKECALCTYLVILGHVDGKCLVGAEELAARGALHHPHRPGHQVALLAEQQVRLELGLVVKGLGAEAAAVETARRLSASPMAALQPIFDIS